MSESSVPYECLLPDQMIHNLTCVRETKIIEIAKSGDVILDEILDYNEVVNMEDITELSGKEFADQFELLPIEKPDPIKPNEVRPNLRKSKGGGRTANLLQKSKDSDNIPDTETWETGPEIRQEAPRIRNKEL